MRVNVLGATEVWVRGARVDLGAHKRRALVAALALSGGRPVSVDALVDLLWGDAPPDGAAGTLQAYVSGLRRVLEPERAPRAAARALVTVPPGYALRIDEAGGLDAARLAEVAHETRRRLGRRHGTWEPPAGTPDDLVPVLAELDEALGLWRGDPYLELGDAPAAAAERARLEELRLVVLEDRAVVLLALGHHAAVAAELEALNAAYPLREQLWGLRALALAVGGRQADALDALGRVRDTLLDDLGLEPGPELRDLHTALLRQELVAVWKAWPGRHAGPGPALDSRPRPSRPAAPPPQWPLVGRDSALATLVGRLEEAEAGTPAFAVVTGEPGIGKSRLCTELAGVAAERTARVLVGRCSQDDGAPPLWPWQQILTDLGADLDLGGRGDEGAEFRARHAIVTLVADAAAEGTLVLVLDDLHWADPLSLRVLRLLLDTVQTGPLLTVCTWRRHPQPGPSLGDVAEALGRRHAARLDLRGLEPADAARIVAAVAGRPPGAAQTARLLDRTDGNPFFLVEYARLARERGDLDALLDEPDPPAAVGDVLTRRLQRLPEESRDLVSWAGVVGREFGLEVLAEAVGLSEDTVLDRLEAAVQAGLVREDGVGSFVFAHALVRDTE